MAPLVAMFDADDPLLAECAAKVLARAARPMLAHCAAAKQPVPKSVRRGAGRTGASRERAAAWFAEASSTQHPLSICSLTDVPVVHPPLWLLPTLSCLAS